MELDRQHYMPQVLQAVAGKDYNVYAYIDDGTIRLVNVADMVKKGNAWAPLQDYETFTKTLTVLNGTVSWDVSGKHDPWDCLDIDPCAVYECEIVDDPLVEKA